MKKKTGITIVAMFLIIAMMAAPVSAGRGNFVYNVFDRWKISIMQLSDLFQDQEKPDTIEMTLDSNVVSHNSRVIKLSWTAADCDYYEIQRDTREDFSTADTDTTKNTEYMYCTFGASYYHYPAHQTYYFRVRPVSGYVLGDWSDTVVAQGD